MSLREWTSKLSEQDRRELGTTLCLLLVAVTAAVYAQMSIYEFLNYDDYLFVLDNPHVYTGLRLANIKWAFTTLHGDASYWHPLTWLSLQLDCQLFGLRPGAFHLTNLCLHCASGALLFTFLNSATGKTWRGAAVAALFALHPLHIESVAWVSERKGLLCAFFWLLTLKCYVRYVRSPGPLNYALVLLPCTASLMSKPFAVTLPFVLLVVDWWPLKRFEQVQTKKADGAASSVFRFFPLLILEKAPLFALSAMGSYLTILGQRDLGAISSLGSLPLGVRFCNSVIAYFLYIQKTVWPGGLAPIYPFRPDWPWWQVLGCALFLCCVTLLALRLTRRRPYLLAGWCWYLGTLVPVIGLLQAGAQGMADRYTYISLIGLFVGVVWGISDLAQNSQILKRPLAIGGATIIATYALISVTQLPNWKNSVRLFEHATKTTNKNFMAYHLLGLAFMRKGNVAEAESNFKKSISIDPNEGLSHSSLARAFSEKGDVESAFNEHSLALLLNSNDPEIHANLADLQANSSDPKFHNLAKAEYHARRAYELSHHHRRSMLVLLASICCDAKKFEQATDAATRALNLSFSPQEINECKTLITKIQTCKARKK